MAKHIIMVSVDPMDFGFDYALVVDFLIQVVMKLKLNLFLRL